MRPSSSPKPCLGTIEPKEQPAAADAKAEVERALKEPIGSKRLCEIVKPESKVAIVVDVATRKTPGEILLLPLLAELNGAGVKDENVTVVFGCGTYAAVKPEEAVKLIGEEALKRVKTVSHDCRAPDLVNVGTTKTHGNKVLVNRIFIEADVKVLLGDVDLNYYAGYGGGRKGVLPGICGEETIKQNHGMLVSANARSGNLVDNPVHVDMTEAARLAKVDFIVNVVANRKGEVVKAFAGDLEAAFLEAVKLYDEMYSVTVDRRADIIVVSAGGHPADVSLYEAYKGLDNALDAVKRGGVIILVAECPEGHGNQVFYEWMTRLSRHQERGTRNKTQLCPGRIQNLLPAKSVAESPDNPGFFSARVLCQQRIQAQDRACRQRRLGRSIQDCGFSLQSLGDALWKLHVASV